MILTCPACATQYRLKDDAIPPAGRTVRCAACKHKWHEAGSADGEGAAHTPADEENAGIAPPPPATDAVEQPLAEVPASAAAEQSIAEQPEPEIPAEAAQDDVEQPAKSGDAVSPEWNGEPDPYPAEQDFSAIGAIRYDDEDAPPRRRLWAWIVGLVLFVVAAAAAFYFLAPPELKARAGIAETGQSPLQLMLTTSDRQKLASGNELLAISGRVINLTDREQAVPPIHAELRNPNTNALVYQWTIAPPARSLAPGAAASFNSAEVDVPEGGEILSLSFAT